jgi:hypothetical protein
MYKKYCFILMIAAFTKLAGAVSPAPTELSTEEKEAYVLQAENYFNGLTAFVSKGKQVVILGNHARESSCEIVMLCLDGKLSMRVNTPEHQLLLLNGVLHILTRGKVSRYDANSAPLYKVFSARPLHLDYKSVMRDDSGVYIRLKSGVELYFKLYQNKNIMALGGWSVKGSKKNEIVSVVLTTISANDKSAIPAGIFDELKTHESTSCH